MANQKTTIADTIEEMQLLIHLVSEVAYRSKYVDKNLSEKSESYGHLLTQYNNTYPIRPLNIATCKTDAAIIRVILNRLSFITKEV